MSRFSLMVNGNNIDTDVAPDTPILWVLRDHLNLVGTKFGCGAAQCGAFNAGLCLIDMQDIVHFCVHQWPQVVQTTDGLHGGNAAEGLGGQTGIFADHTGR